MTKGGSWKRWEKRVGLLISFSEVEGSQVVTEVGEARNRGLKIFEAKLLTGTKNNRASKHWEEKE